MVRKTVTLVFCDVADSTPLGEQLDPEALRGVWTRYHDTARAVLERHGGTVEKFVGDAVLGVFGIPVVHEDDALRAVRAAVELRDDLARLNDDLERAFGVRIGVRTGVHTGEVYAGDPSQGDPFATGDAVVIAQRLESSAEAGEILAGDATISLVRDAVTVEPVSALELKGKSEPVDAWRLLDVEPEAAGLARRRDTPLVGRGAELDELLAELERVLADRACRVVTIVGEPGVGKSRLAAELVSTLGDDALVLEGRCLPYGNGITYWPLVEIVRDLDLEQVLGDDAAHDRILEAIGRAEPHSRTDEIYAAVRRLLETLAVAQPLVVVLDDIQWAEPAFLDLIEYLAGWSRDAPILVCCLARPDLAEVRPAWGGATIHLAPLPREQSRALLENLAGPLDADAADAVSRATGGNPLFLEEMLRMLVEDGVLVERDGRLEPLAAVDTLRVPGTVQAVLAARLDRLAEDELAVLQRAAVIGQIFWWGAVAELSPPELVGEVAGRLQALVRKGLVKPDARTFAGEDGFRFGHILIRDAAYDSISKRLRGDLHERFAAWVEQRAGESAELDEIAGHHLEQAYRFRLELGPAGEEEAALASRAAARLLRAGRRALGRGDVHAARGLLERASALLATDDPRDAELVPELGLVLTVSGELAAAEAVLSSVIERDDAPAPVRLAARIERVALRLRSDPRGGWEHDLRLVEDALPALEAETLDRPAHRALARGWFLVGLVRGLWAGQVARGEDALRKARNHAAAAGDRWQEAEIVGRLGFAAWSGPLPVHEGIGLCVSLLESAPDDLLLEACCRRWIGCLVAREGRFDEARELVDAAVEAYEELGSRIDAVSAAAFGRADVELLAGDVAAAEQALRGGYDALGALGELGHRASVAAMLARTLRARGLREEADGFARLVEETASEEDIWSQVLCRVTRAGLLADAGELDEAEAVAREAQAIVARTDLLDLHGDVLVDLAAILGLQRREEERRGSLEHALELYEAKANRVAADRARAALAVEATT
ncbi:MAG: AAA family ATPase [Thermoleophilia bacterium]|nr:AAA family ATPase [Thermoleophilia bacterium]